MLSLPQNSMIFTQFHSLVQTHYNTFLLSDVNAGAIFSNKQRSCMGDHYLQLFSRCLHLSDKNVDCGIWKFTGYGQRMKWWSPVAFISVPIDTPKILDFPAYKCYGFFGGCKHIIEDPLIAKMPNPP